MSFNVDKRKNEQQGVGMIPNYVRPFLWSYNTDKIDLEKHKDRIVVNVLKFGNKKSTEWVTRHYSENEIKKILEGPVAIELDPKSRAYFELVYDVTIPKKKTINV
ncbi:hypothetical protein KKH43_01585 [Patescibacteria group bacterium]|nr:hypothetical protein [Patescibacteria group bacterium]